MANGGFYGTEEEWTRLEAPLVALDKVLAKFAKKHSLVVTKNHKNNPERSIRWCEDISYLIQIWLVDEELLTMNLWICASEDRCGKRFLKEETPVKEKSLSEFESDLPRLLEESYKKLRTWTSQKLPFTVRLPPLPPGY